MIASARPAHFLERPDLAQELAEHNYQLAKRYYSYGVLEHSLQTLLADLFGIDPLT